MQRQILKYKQELGSVYEQNIDIMHFEEDLMPFGLALLRTIIQLLTNFGKAETDSHQT